MALRVWLPLNGNIENKGLSDACKGEGTLTYGDGKIGKALYMETASTANGIYAPKQEKQVYTVALWFKAPGYTGTRRDLCNEGRDYNTYGWRVGLSANENTLTIMAAGSGGQYTQSFTPDTWYHIAFCRDENKTAYYYINGVLVSTKTGTGDLNYSESNGFINIGRFCCNPTSNSKLYPYQGYINDFRYYDECLSPKQIKEISKGLVAHYPLKGTCANPNLLIHADSYMINNKLHRTSTVADGYYSVKMYYNNLDTTKYYIYSVCCDGTLSDKHGVVTGGDYTSNSWSLWLYFREEDYSDSSYSSYTTPVCYHSAVSTYMGQIGNRYYWKITPPYKSCAVRVNTYSDGEHNVNVNFWDFKLEEGEQLTNWIPNINDTKYTILGYDKMWAIDESGYGYNGTVAGTLTFNNDSPRYEGSTKFDANTSYIKLPVLTTGGFASSFTIIYWANIADMNGKMAWGFGDGNRLNIYPTGSVICCNIGDGANNPYQNNGSSIAYSQWNNGWHQFAMVADGSTNKLYVDGQFQGTAKTYKGITGTQMYISGWDTGTNYRWVNGSISDFRFYATALTADEILTIYKNSGIIDNKGNVYAYEFKEE